jgi:hypothetical protein
LWVDGLADIVYLQQRSFCSPAPIGYCLLLLRHVSLSVGSVIFSLDAVGFDLVLLVTLLLTTDFFEGGRWIDRAAGVQWEQNLKSSSLSVGVITITASFKMYPGH